MTEVELARAEALHGFRFPPDLRSLLSLALPVGERFPDWRNPESEQIRKQLAWPLEGIQFDIEHNGFWWEPWGRRPKDLGEAFEIARVRVEEAPRLIPVYGHRYLPAEPDRLPDGHHPLRRGPSKLPRQRIRSGHGLRLYAPGASPHPLLDRPD